MTSNGEMALVCVILPPDRGVLWNDLRKIFRECQWMANVPNGEENCRKFQPAK